MAASAEWLFRCIYALGGAARRAGALPAHEAFIRAHVEQIRFAGPLFAEDGTGRTGTWFFAEAPDRRAAEDFIAGEGFNRAGLIGGIEIRRFAESSPDDRRQVLMRADPDKEMYLCELDYAGENGGCGDRPLGERAGFTGEILGCAIIEGPLLSDDGSRIIGEACIIEVDSRAAAEELIRRNVAAGGGPLSRIRIDRWRFGATIG